MGQDHTQKLIEEAKKTLRRKGASPDALFELAKELKKRDQFGWARRLLAKARRSKRLGSPFREKLCQQHALCTYKDTSLPARRALDDALDILASEFDLARTRNQETLGLAGAIFKRKWGVDSQKTHLEKALSYYGKGYRIGPRKDNGYTGINAAYVLDTLAYIEEKEISKIEDPSQTVKTRRKMARDIRSVLARELPILLKEKPKLQDDWWLLVTIAEAFFGLRKYSQAKRWLARAKALGAPKWEYKSTAMQLAHLAQIQQAYDTHELEKSKPWNALKAFLDNNVAALRTSFLGKVGLGLSGGGFRASLFHVGVLAKLAELDMLRHIHALSCVSGGSIIGALYYLELKQLLEEKPDNEITREDYEALVLKILKNFLAGVQRNIRIRLISNPKKSFKMVISQSYSRTVRAGELFEEEIYATVNDGKGSKPRWMDELFIIPVGEDKKQFRPKVDNWRRENKVPMLVLNATTLNTGHSWQFTASWMGESPSAIDPEIDSNDRLQRMYYRQAPEGFKKIRLGTAVGASASVPGLFEPIALAGLYPDITVRLVDGGVHDNQGIASLLDLDCDVLLISDASGQITTDPNSKGGFIFPLFRSNSVLMERVRQTQFQDLNMRFQASLLKGLMILHLKKELDTEIVARVNSREPQEAGTKPNEALTSYGLAKDIQELLAGIRTDLDSFSEVEAFALMASGYKQTEVYAKNIRGFPNPGPSKVKWPFLVLETFLKAKSGKSIYLRKLLSVGSKSAFKIWALSKPLKTTSIILGVLAMIGFLWVWWTWSSKILLTLDVNYIGWSVFSILAFIFLGKLAYKLLSYNQTLVSAAIAIGMGILGWILAQVHLHVFDRWFLNAGKVSSLKKLKKN